MDFCFTIEWQWPQVSGRLGTKQQVHAQSGTCTRRGGKKGLFNEHLPLAPACTSVPGAWKNMITKKVENAVQNHMVVSSPLQAQLLFESCSNIPIANCLVPDLLSLCLSTHFSIGKHHSAASSSGTPWDWIHCGVTLGPLSRGTSREASQAAKWGGDVHQR